MLNKKVDGTYKQYAVRKFKLNSPSSGRVPLRFWTPLHLSKVEDQENEDDEEHEDDNAIYDVFSDDCVLLSLFQYAEGLDQLPDILAPFTSQKSPIPVYPEAFPSVSILLAALGYSSS
jgi:hypothetical protein